MLVKSFISSLIQLFHKYSNCFTVPATLLRIQQEVKPDTVAILLRLTVYWCKKEIHQSMTPTLKHTNTSQIGVSKERNIVL